MNRPTITIDPAIAAAVADGRLEDISRGEADPMFFGGDDAAGALAYILRRA